MNEDAMDPTTARWDAYLALAWKRRNDIDSIERHQEDILAKSLRGARAALLRDDDDWPALLTAAVTRKDNSVIFYVNRIKLTNWIEGNRRDARQALREMWSQGNRSPDDRVRAFDIRGPESVWPQAAVGTRLTSASYLMMGLDAQRYPPYQRNRFSKAFRRLRYPLPSAKDAGGVYLHVLGLLDRLLAEARKCGMDWPHTRLEAQSIVWQDLASQAAR